MTIRQEVNQATTLKSLWNQVIIFKGITIGGIMWHDNQWKVLPSGTTFNEASKDDFKPIAEFYYQKDLQKYLLDNIK